MAGVTLQGDSALGAALLGLAHQSIAGRGLAFVRPRNTPFNPNQPDYTTVLSAEPGLVGLWSLQEVNAANPAAVVDSKNANNLTIFRYGTGVNVQRRSLLRWDTTKASYVFSDKASGNCFNGPAGAPLDMTGSLPFSMMCMAAPNVTRTGSLIHYTIAAKRNQAANSAGYEFGLVWDGTKTVLYFLIANTDAAAIEVRSSIDLANGVAFHAAMTYSGSGTAAGVALYVNGVQAAPTVVLDALSGSATNATKFNIGGRNGNSQFLSGWVSHFAFFSTTVSAARVAALAYPTKRQRIPRSGAVPRTLFWIDDNDSDIDGVQSLRVGMAAYMAGDSRWAAYVGSTSNLYSVAATEAMLTAQGIVIPLGQYQGAGHDGGSLWTQTVAQNFNPGKTKANYTEAVTVIRTVLAGMPDKSIDAYIDIGPLHVTQAFMQSAGDSISPLTGLQLMAAKCVAIYNMGGYASNVAAEYNFAQAPAAANYVYANNPVPIFNVPFEMASGTNIGTAGNGDIEPCRKAFELFKQASYSRSSTFDVLAVYAAIYPNTPNFSLAVANGTCSVDAGTGVNTWSASAGTHNRYQIATTAAAVQVAMENLDNDAF